MKYVLTWKPRGGGEAEALRRRRVFKAWTPPGDIVFHQFLTRLDGEGGFAVLECDNPASILQAPATFVPWFEFTITPVMDIAGSVAVFDEAEAFRGRIE